MTALFEIRCVIRSQGRYQIPLSIDFDGMSSPPAAEAVDPEGS